MKIVPILYHVIHIEEEKRIKEEVLCDNNNVIKFKAGNKQLFSAEHRRGEKVDQLLTFVVESHHRTSNSQFFFAQCENCKQNHFLVAYYCFKFIMLIKWLDLAF